MACRCPPQPAKVLGPWASISASLVGGLLSSSCCALQLGLNALGLGCAGFAVFTPYEPLLRGITIAALTTLVLRDGINKRSLLTIALSLGLMFSQDAVRTYNRSGLSSLLTISMPQHAPAAPKQHAGGTEGNADMASASAAPSWEARDTQMADQGSVSADADAAEDVGSSAARRAGRGTAPAAATAKRPAAGAAVVGEAGAATDAAADVDDGYDDDEEEDDLRAGGQEVEVESIMQDGNGGAPLSSSLYFRFSVEGIKCEGCAARLKAALLRLPGVQRCAVDYASKQVLLWGAGKELGATQVRAAIQHVDLSYRVTLEESREL